MSFQLTAARRRLRFPGARCACRCRFNSQPLEGGCQWRSACLAEQGRFNSQPLEGGCLHAPSRWRATGQFQLTAARRRLPFAVQQAGIVVAVSTHSRSKAAAANHVAQFVQFAVSTHSRSKAAALAGAAWCRFGHGFNSQPLEGGCLQAFSLSVFFILFQLTAARRRLLEALGYDGQRSPFQLTAARRRLRSVSGSSALLPAFQLTAARRRLRPLCFSAFTQLPFQLTAARRRLREKWRVCNRAILFQLTAARRRLQQSLGIYKCQIMFQLTAARRRLPADRQGR